MLRLEWAENPLKSLFHRHWACAGSLFFNMCFKWFSVSWIGFDMILDSSVLQRHRQSYYCYIFTQAHLTSQHMKHDSSNWLEEADLATKTPLLDDKPQLDINVELISIINNVVWWSNLCNWWYSEEFCKMMSPQGSVHDMTLYFMVSQQRWRYVLSF